MVYIAMCVVCACVLCVGVCVCARVRARMCVCGGVCVVYVCAYESRWVLWVGVCEGYMCTCVGVSGCMSLYCAFLRGVCVYLQSLLTECVCSCCMHILQHCRKWYR